MFDLTLTLYQRNAYMSFLMIKSAYNYFLVTHTKNYTTKNERKQPKNVAFFFVKNTITKYDNIIDFYY